MSATDEPAEDETHHPTARLAPLVVGAIGIVFGDIGTSPLYTFQECIGEHGVAPHRGNILGILSLIVWSLTFVVTIKYLLFVMRADNRGEGGILALLALVPERLRGQGAKIGWVSVLVVAGAALLFGDGIITPAISVLSAMEGLEAAKPGLHKLVVPLTCVVLFGLFAIQQRGTGGIGKLFGPVMVVWFLTIGSLGAYHIAKNPAVLEALSPVHAVSFFAHHGFRGFEMLGAVVLAVTGGEALYADMGHFGKRPIRLAWLALVFPSLILCYYGQGALVMANPSLATQPFFGMVPEGPARYAMVALAAPATVIASQALISGVFSLTHQAVRLGFFPRVEVRHTAGEAEGQIYVPTMNWGLAAACIGLVLLFQQSSRLAAAYGLAVTGTMAITSIVFYTVTVNTWGWSKAKALPVLVLFLSFDLPFLGANMLKFIDGGYVPVVVGLGFFVTMMVWRRGRGLLANRLGSSCMPLTQFVANLDSHVRVRSPGASVFLSSLGETIPPMLARLAQQVGVISETLVMVTVTTEHRPVVDDAKRMKVESLGKGVYRVIARYGFMEMPNIPAVLTRAIEAEGLPIDLRKVTYFVGRETFLATDAGEMNAWAEGWFAFLSRNAHSATTHFGVPPEQVVEIGTEIDL